MRIQQLDVAINRTTNLNNKKTNKQQTIQYHSGLNSMELTSQYNIAFCGLFNRDTQAIDATNIETNLQMVPQQRYKINKDTTFELGNKGYKVSLDSPLMSEAMSILNRQKKIIIGRSNICLTGMDDTISRAHLKLTQDKQGQIFAEDIGSKNGTLILPSITKMDSTKSHSLLDNNRKYLVPINSILEVKNTKFSLQSYKDILDDMKEGQIIVAGSNPNCDIQITSSDIAEEHFEIEKRKDGLLIKILDASTTTTFLGIEERKTDYKQDYSNITEKTMLSKGEPTLLPKNSQLYLGNNYTIDIRNPNILSALDKKGEITIGRLSTNDVVVPSFYDKVSSEHLRLEKSGEHIIATDLNSSKDTYVIPQNKIEAFYGGIEDIKIGQGNIGDCYLLTILYSLSLNSIGQKLLNHMVKVDENGNYAVKFHGTENPITVKLEELDGQKRENGDEKVTVSGDLGFKAIERAYAKKVHNSRRETSTLFADINNGGRMDTALEQITGFKSKQYKTKQENMNAIFFRLAMDKFENHIITCATGRKGKYDGYVDSEHRFAANHAYSVKYISLARKEIGIVDPHDTRKTINISWEDYNKYFDTLFDCCTKNKRFIYD